MSNKLRSLRAPARQVGRGGARLKSAAKEHGLTEHGCWQRIAAAVGGGQNAQKYREKYLSLHKESASGHAMTMPCDSAVRRARPGLWSQTATEHFPGSLGTDVANRLPFRSPSFTARASVEHVSGGGSQRTLIRPRRQRRRQEMSVHTGGQS